MEQEHKCNRCGLGSPFVKFDRRDSGNLRPTCQKCQHEARKVNFQARKEAGERDDCKQCKKNLPLSEFHVLARICKTCTAENRKAERDTAAVSRATKPCSKCGEETPLTRFAHGALICSSCMHLNKPARVFYLEVKKASKCADCGYDDWRALDFAHWDASTKARDANGKPIEISRMAKVEQVREELKKGRFLCARHHRLETFQRTDFEEWLMAMHPAKRAIARLIAEEKARRGRCVDCGMEFSLAEVSVFEFDHLPGTDKKFDIAFGANKVKPAEEVIAEMAVCEMVCVCCHRIRTYQRLQESKKHYREIDPDEQEGDQPKSKRQKTCALK